MIFRKTQTLKYQEFQSYFQTKWNLRQKSLRSLTKVILYCQIVYLTTDAFSIA